MTKEEILKLMGKDMSPEDMAAKIAEATAAELKWFIPKARFDEVNGKLKTAEATIADRDASLTALQSSGDDSAALKQQILQLQAENKTQADAHATELQALKKGAAVDAALTAANAKNLTAAKAVLAAFLETAELEADGSVKGLADEIAKHQKDEATAFLYGAEAKPKPIIAGAVPANTPGASPAVTPAIVPMAPILI